MTNVLGLELDEAAALLAKEGYLVETVEARSRKGVASADSRRVIRVIELEGREAKTVQLVFSEFRTFPIQS